MALAHKVGRAKPRQMQNGLHTPQTAHSFTTKAICHFHFPSLSFAQTFQKCKKLSQKKTKQKHQLLIGQSAAPLGWQVQSIGQSAGTNKRPRTDKTKHKLILAVPVITSSGQVKGLGQLIGWETANRPVSSFITSAFAGHVMAF